MWCTDRLIRQRKQATSWLTLQCAYSTTVPLLPRSGGGYAESFTVLVETIFGFDISRVDAKNLTIAGAYHGRSLQWLQAVFVRYEIGVMRQNAGHWHGFEDPVVRPRPLKLPRGPKDREVEVFTWFRFNSGG